MATWNVHDLFDADDRVFPPGAEDEILSPAQAEARLAAVGEGILALDADVVLLQEVENARVLAALAARAGYPEARLVEGNDPRGIDVALLSRWPVESYLSDRTERDEEGRLLWPRDCVVAAVRVAGARLVVVGTHLSSRVSDDGTRRARQAARLRAIADGAAGGEALVLAGGDLNDDADDAALAPLLGDGAWFSAGPPAWTWTDGDRTARLDHWAIRSEDAGALAWAAVPWGEPWAAASDHRPVLVELHLP